MSEDQTTPLTAALMNEQANSATNAGTRAGTGSSTGISPVSTQNIRCRIPDSAIQNFRFSIRCMKNAANTCTMFASDWMASTRPTAVDPAFK